MPRPATQISASARVLFNTAAPQDTPHARPDARRRGAVTTLTASLGHRRRLRLRRPLDRDRRDRRLGRQARHRLRRRGRRRLQSGCGRRPRRPASTRARPATPTSSWRWRPTTPATASSRRRRRQAPTTARVPNLGAVPDVGQTTPGRRAAAGAEPAAVDQSAVRPGAGGRSRRPPPAQAVRVRAGAAAVHGRSRSPPASRRATPASGRWPCSSRDGRHRRGQRRRQPRRALPLRSGRRRGAAPARARSTTRSSTWRSTRDGELWATTGGGPLLQLDPQHRGGPGPLRRRHHPGARRRSGRPARSTSPPATASRSSTRSRATFTPLQRRPRRRPRLRPGRRALGHDAGRDRGDVVQFDQHGPARRSQVRLDADVDSIAFGRRAAQLDGLLFVSANDARRRPGRSELTMVDLATLKVLARRHGRPARRGLAATPDGRVLVSQRAPGRRPRPARGASRDRHQPARQALRAPAAGRASPSPSTRTCRPTPADPARSSTRPTTPCNATAPPRPSCRSAMTAETRTAFWRRRRWRRATTSSPWAPACGVGPDWPSSQAYATAFAAVQDFSTARPDRLRDHAVGPRHRHRVVRRPRHQHRRTTICSTPLALVLDPARFFAGQPAAPAWPTGDGLWLARPRGGPRRRPPAPRPVNPASTRSPSRTPRASAPTSATASTRCPTPNTAPVFDSQPVTAAAVGQPYRYEAACRRPGRHAVAYLLLSRPGGDRRRRADGRRDVGPDGRQPATKRPWCSAPTIRAAAMPRRRSPSRSPAATTRPRSSRSPRADRARKGSRSSWPSARRTPTAMPWPLDRQLAAGRDVRRCAARAGPGRRASRPPASYRDVRLIATDGRAPRPRASTSPCSPANAPPVVHAVPDRTVREGDPSASRSQATDPDGRPR